MAATRMSESTKLLLKVEYGATSSGGTSYRTRTFANVNPDATDDSAFSVGSKLAAMQSHTLAVISRQDTASLKEA